MLLFTVISYISLYLALAFCALCLATGLYYLAELAEEFTALTKKVLAYMIWFALVVHPLLWIVDGFPFWTTTIGFASHVVYYQLLHRFPFIDFKSPAFIASCVMFVADHVVWYFHFVNPNTPTFNMFKIFGFFFTCVWMVPLGFFVTLSVNDLVLPGSGELSSRSGGTIIKDKKRTNVIRLAWNWAKRLVLGRSASSLPGGGDDGDGTSLGFDAETLRKTF